MILETRRFKSIVDQVLRTLKPSVRLVSTNKRYLSQVFGALAGRSSSSLRTLDIYATEYRFQVDTSKRVAAR